MPRSSSDGVKLGGWCWSHPGGPSLIYIGLREHRAASRVSASGVGRAPQPRHQQGRSFCSFHEAWRNLAFPRLPTRFGIFQSPGGAEQRQDGSSPLPLSFSPALVEAMRSLQPLCCLLAARTPTVRTGTCLIELAVNETSFHIPCFYFAALFSRFRETLLHQTSCRDGESVLFFFFAI